MLEGAAGFVVVAGSASSKPWQFQESRTAQALRDLESSS